MVGGGLAGCLAALKLAAKGLDICVLEADSEICGNHTWSFHGTDIHPDDRDWLKPMIVHSWPGQKVIFPGYQRQLSTPYASITSDRLRAVVTATEGIDVREDSAVRALMEDQVELEDGTVVNAPCILDCRGFVASPGLQLGHQKFVGLEVELAEPHGETVPTIMDASVSQRDGYRFVYVLPLAPKRLLIEDTRYSDEGALDIVKVHRDTLDYARDRGWTVTDTPRSENGILPITLAQDIELFWQAMPDNSAPIGLRAGLFHPTTGYSLPMAVGTANLLARLDRPLTT
ncbi:MAG: lycopene beta-cyclase CrtY, partial [Pseudomonadota bacterium]